MAEPLKRALIGRLFVVITQQKDLENPLPDEEGCVCESVFSFQFSVFSFRFSVFGFQFSVFRASNPFPFLRVCLWLNRNRVSYFPLGKVINVSVLVEGIADGVLRAG